MNSEDVMDDVAAAAVAAEAKHGRLTGDPVRACAILGREWGEAMNEALLLTVPGAEARSKHRKQLYDELAQVAATAMLAMENIDL